MCHSFLHSKYRSMLTRSSRAHIYSDDHQDAWWIHPSTSEETGRGELDFDWRGISFRNTSICKSCDNCTRRWPTGFFPSKSARACTNSASELRTRPQYIKTRDSKSIGDQQSFVHVSLIDERNAASTASTASTCCEEYFDQFGRHKTC